MSGPIRAEVVVVGAGLAGLATALHLQRGGVEVTVLEAAETVGGRVRTDVVDGFRLDRGFQLYNPAYPEGAAMFDHARLDLKPFERGARVIIGDSAYRLGDPRAHPTWLTDVLRAPVGGIAGLGRFALYALRCASTDPRKLESADDMPVRLAFEAAGLDAPLIDHLLRPFLSGVFLEGELSTSRRFADLVLRSFVRGTPAIPSLGMQALPEQLAGQVHSLHLGNPVQSVDGTRVRTDSGEIEARAVVVAVDPTSVSQLVPQIGEVRTHSCTTWYHVPTQGPTELADGLALLTLDGDGRGPLVNSAVLTHAAPSYAPPGYSLVSSTALGIADDHSEKTVRKHLQRLYGVDTSGWECIASYAVDPALPAMDVPLQTRKSVQVGPGVFVAGDHRDTASIQGALVSGRRAAQAVIGALGSNYA